MKFPKLDLDEKCLRICIDAYMFSSDEPYLCIALNDYRNYDYITFHETSFIKQEINNSLSGEIHLEKALDKLNYDFNMNSPHNQRQLRIDWLNHELQRVTS